MTETSKNVLINSLRVSSKKKYETYLKQWQMFCNNRRIDTVTVVDIVNFLSELFVKAYHTARSKWLSQN